MLSPTHLVTQVVHETEDIMHQLASNSQTITYLQAENQTLEKKLASFGSIDETPEKLWEDWNTQINSVISDAYRNWPTEGYTFKTYCRINKKGNMSWEIWASNGDTTPIRALPLNRVNLPLLKTHVWEKTLMFGMTQGFYRCIEV